VGVSPVRVRVPSPALRSQTRASLLPDEGLPGRTVGEEGRGPIPHGRTRHLHGVEVVVANALMEQQDAHRASGIVTLGFSVQFRHKEWVAVLDGPTSGRFLGRLIGAMRLDRRVYADVSVDTAANSQAFLVVLLSGACNGLGLARELGSAGMSAGVVAAVASWFLWTGVILAAATLLRSRHRTGSLLRALGFANAPGVALLLAIIPGVGRVVRVATVFWLLAATVVAVEVVFAASRRRACLISLCGFIVYLVVGIISAYFASAS
jgi:hypothetical protein